jgi:hypothetical protein
LPERVHRGEGGADVEEAGNQSIKRAAGGAVRALGADYIHLNSVLGAEGEGGVVPDGVGDDVVHGVEWTLAVAADEEA